MAGTKIENYIELYNLAIPISKIKAPVQDKSSSTYETYTVLKLSKAEVRVFDRDKHMQLLLDQDKYFSIQNFLKDEVDISHRFFYMIPVQTPKGTIVGFILRTVFGKSYMTISNSFEDRVKSVPFMFGWYKDFARYNKEDKRLPIVVCEGSKDCIALKKIYPYTLSTNTDSLGTNIEVLKQITNDILLVYDNDESGLKGMKKDQKKLLNQWVNCDTFYAPDGYKDVASLLVNDREAFTKFGKCFFKRIKKLHLHHV